MGGPSVDVKLPRIVGKIGRTSSLTEYIDWEVEPAAAYEVSACFLQTACNTSPQQIADFLVPKLPSNSEYRGLIRLTVHVMGQSGASPKAVEIVLSIGSSHVVAVEEHGLYDWTDDTYTFTAEVQTQLQTTSFPWCHIVVSMENPPQTASYAQATGELIVTCVPANPA